MKKLLYALLVALSLSPALAQDSGTYANMGACAANNPRMYFVVDAFVSGSCSAGGGTGQSQCCCLNAAWANCATGGSGAPTTSDYLVKTADGGLSAERVVTDNSYVTWDWATAGQVKATVVDLSCANCISGTEIDESGLGTVPTATALAANPADCSTSDGTEAAWRINASGDLSCTTIAFTSKTLDRKSSATTVNNTVTETAVYSYTIPAGTLDANGEIVLTLWSEFLNNTGVGRGYIIKVKLGGTTVIEFDMGSSALVSTTTRRLSQTVVSLAALGATNSQIVTMRHEISSRTGLSGTLTTGVGTTMSTAVQMLTVNSGALSQDMTTSKVLEVSITLSTNSTNLEWKAYAGTLELLNP